MQFKALGSAGDNPLQDVGEIGERLNAVELTGLDQRICNCPVTRSGVRTGEERVLPGNDHGLDGALDNVRIHLQPTVVQIQAQL